MNKSKKQVILGAHLSIQGGFYKAIESAPLIGATAVQIFTRSSRSWKGKSVSQEDKNLWNQAIKNSVIDQKNIVAHTSYLINLGSFNQELVDRSISALIEELNQAEALNIPTIVLHPGSRLDFDLETCINQIAANLVKTLEKANSSATIALETMAGQGSSVGSSFEELAHIIDKIPSQFQKRIGICVDTCHVFAAGYQFDTKENYQSMWKHFDKILGLDNLKAIHLNDSKTMNGSHVDRHEQIGKGKISIEAFKLIMNDPHLRSIPKILETPKKSLQDYAENIRILLNLID